MENWNSSVSLQGKIAGLWAHLSGRAPFFKTEEVVVSADGHAWLIHKEDFASAAKAMKEAKAVVVEDSKVFLESDFPTENIPFFDISLAAYLLDPTRVTYPLSYIAGLFGKPVIYPDDLDDRKEKGCCITLFLASLYEEAVKKLSENGVLSLFQKVEQPLVPVLAAMEKAGIATDQEKWRAVKEEMEKEERILMKDIFTEAGEAFNLNSPKQLGHILFEKMGMPAGKKTKTGYSTAADVLEELAVSYPMVKNILRYRTLSKLVSTYLEALPQLINPETGRIHTSFNQTVTATGRLSSSDPNLQNIPVRTEEGKKIRSLFVPGEGYDCFISSDYSQVELRVLAHMSGDESLIKAFINQEDIHRRTAAEVMGIPFEDVTPEQRSHAKAVNFGIIYGISDFGLAKQLGIPRKQAADYIDAYFKRYPSIHDFMQSMVEKAKETGRAVTLFGRYRELPDINSKNFNRRSFAERTAMNTPIQGTAADIIKAAMVRVDARMRAEHLQARLLLQVHDELIVECPAEEAETVKAILVDEMEHVVDYRVPLLVDAKIGVSWAEAH